MRRIKRSMLRAYAERKGINQAQLLRFRNVGQAPNPQVRLGCPPRQSAARDEAEAQVEGGVMSGPESNPNFVCPLCKYADRGASSWPCRSCKRANEMKDYFEPDDEALDVPQTVLDDPYPAAARRLMEKFSVNCGNCPATVLCMARYANPPKTMSDNCVDAFAFWLKRGAGA